MSEQATITQEDREAAAALNPGVARFYLNGSKDHYKIVQAFAARRIAAEKRIVEWLRNEQKEYPASQYSGFAAMIADAIEAGGHLKPVTAITDI